MTFPIPEHPSWHKIDSSKMETYHTCARQFFYRYLLGWRPNKVAIDLIFGQAWHAGRELQLLHGYDKVEEAYNAFLKTYREEIHETEDEFFAPKSPQGAFIAYSQLPVRYPRDLTDNKVLFTETSGKVPIDNNRYIYYRMDSIIERKSDGKIFSWDHKSTKSFSRTWADQFLLSIQTGTYTHCMYCLFPIEQVIGIEYCGTQFEFLKRRSSQREAGYHVNFQRVPAWKTPEQMNIWLYTVNHYYDSIMRDMELLESSSPDDSVMQCFPINPGSCSKYWGCIYHDYCITWPNPLARCQEPPLGFKLEFWDPTEHETTNKMDLEWKGN